MGSRLGRIIPLVATLSLYITTMILYIHFILVPSISNLKRGNGAVEFSLALLVFVFLYAPVLALYTPMLAIYRTWKFSDPKFKRAREELQQSKLCDVCRNIVLRSKLLRGSRWIFARLVEWHEHHPSFEELSKSAYHCHLCAMVLNSVKRQDVILAQELAQPSPLATEVTPLLGSNIPAPPIEFKIWEQRPLTGHTYLRAFCDKKPISDRLHLTKSLNHPLVPEDTRNKDTTGSEAHVNLAMEWIKRCNESHNCYNSNDSGNWLPKRLVEIKLLENREYSENVLLRLVTTATLTSPVLYTAVSYCWGAFEGYKLTALNYSEALCSIPEHQVPQTLRDAIFFTYRMGIKYLWIDSMCIIQGDVEDWRTESSQMHTIYANAYLTIAGSCASSAEQPLYRTRDPRLVQSCPILGKSAIRNELADFENNVNYSPLSKRAWAFQERLLSSRILHFGPEMLYWECRLRSASEIYRNGFIFKSFETEYSDHRPRWRDPFQDRSRLEDLQSDWSEIQRQIKLRRDQNERQRWRSNVERRQPVYCSVSSDPARLLDGWHEPRMLWYDERPWSADLEIYQQERMRSGVKAAFESLRQRSFSKTLTDPNSFHQRWYELVAVYTRGQLTESSDKLAAFDGITQAIAKNGNLQTNFGLWMPNLLLSLLWFTSEGGQRPPESRAPTWSWASLDGPISYGVPAVYTKSQQVLLGYTAVVSENQSGNAWRAYDVDKDWFGMKILRVMVRTCTVVGLEARNGALFLLASQERYIGRFFPDVSGENLSNDTNLHCALMLSLIRPLKEPHDEELQCHGLVLRQLRTQTPEDSRSRATYERVGYFTTNSIKDVVFDHELFNDVREEEISVV